MYMEGLARLGMFYYRTLDDVTVYFTVAGFVAGLGLRGIQNVNPQSRILKAIGNPPNGPGYALPILGGLTGFFMASTWPISVPIVIVETITSSLRCT